MIDAQFEEAYRFPEVIKAYEKCTKSLRRKELATYRVEEKTKRHLRLRKN